jgi:hypothetical protein
VVVHMPTAGKTKNPIGLGQLSEGGGHWVQEVGGTPPSEGSNGWRKRWREQSPTSLFER